jgi:hypothetical protein
VTWGWIRRNPADHAEPGEILDEEVEPPAEIDVVHLLAEAEQVDHRLALFLQLANVSNELVALERCPIFSLTLTQPPASSPALASRRPLPNA